MILRLLRPVLFFAVLGSAILWLFGQFYEDTYAALLLLLPGFIPLTAVANLSQYLAARTFPPIISLYWPRGLLLNLVLNLLLIPGYGMMAASATSSIA